MSTDLKETFDTVMEYFNNPDNGKYDRLLPFMDADIIMKKVDDPGSVVGIGNVINYLNGRQVQFRPQLTNRIYDGDPDVWKQEGTMAQVSGIGKMYDRTTGEEPQPDPVDVRFTFTFTRSSEKEDWLVIDAFAARKIGE